MRSGDERLDLLVAVCDAALGQVVGREFHGDAITGEDANTVAAEFAGQMGQNGAVGIKLDTEQPTRELFDYSPSHFDTIFFTAIVLFICVMLCVVLAKRDTLRTPILYVRLKIVYLAHFAQPLRRRLRRDVALRLPSIS